MLAAFNYTGGTYQQTFDALGTTTSTVTNRDLETLNTALAGWYFNETGTSANTTITAGTGSVSTGDTYNLGAAAGSDRALGGLQSGSVIPSWGFQLTNNTGSTINALNISYTGQTWRVGAANRSDRIDFEYSVNATSLSTGTWTGVDALDYANPGQATTASGSVLHSSAINGILGSLGLAAGATLFIRWTDFNPSGADDAMGINNFSMSLASATAPTVTTPTSAAITSVGVTLGGTVTSDGNAAVTERGIVFAIKADNAAPEIGGTGATKVAAAAGGTGVFTVPVTGLASGTLYAFKAYATNSQGTTYSDVAEFTTNAGIAAPTVTTPTSTAILDTEATLGGTVASDGGDAVTERGIVYALTSALTPENPTPVIGGPGVTTVSADAAGTGTFTKLVTGLTAASGYTFRAYATNGAGTAYSDPATFTTAAAATAPVVATPTKFFQSTTATLGGTVTADGGRPVTERGIVYAKTADNADPTIDGTGVTTVAGTLGIGTGTFRVAVTGLDALTGYTFKAYATNGVDTSYSALDTFTTYATETSLTAGDIAFTGYQTDDPDGYSFVLLKDVVAGTTVTVTDNGWAFDQSGFTNTTEDTQIVQFGSAYPAGTHFQIAGGGTPTFTVIGSGAGAGTLSGVISGFSTSGDSLLAYQGTMPTSGSAANWIAGVNSKAWATATFTNTSDSALPTALLDGNAIGFTTEQDNGAYNKTSFSGTAAQVRADVNNSANWTRSTNAGPVSTTAFTVATVVTTTSLAVTPAVADFGTSITFAGTVTAGSGTASPTGTVEIRSGGASGTLLAQGTVTASGDGTSSFSFASSSVPTGTYPDVRAYFTASGVFIGSTSDTQSLTINAVGAATTTSLTDITPLSSVFGTAVTFNGTVVAATGTLTPVGTVEIRDGGPTGTLLASTSTITGSDAIGTFSIVSSAVPIGSYASVKAYFKAASQLDFLDSQSDAFGGGTLSVTAAAFTPGNLLVLRVGDGTTPIINGETGNLTGNVTLLEYTPSGALVQAIPVASSGAAAATLRLNSTSEGALSLSADRQTVTFGGFRVDAGPTNPNTGSTGRVIAKIGPGGTVDTAQAISGVFEGDSFRSVVTDDGTTYWLSGAGTNRGIQVVAGGTATTATALTSTTDNNRQVQILDGNLFVSSGSAAPGRTVFQVGVGLPTSGAPTQAATFPASTLNTTQYQSYFFADLDATVGWRNTGYDTLYVTDSGNGSIEKYTYAVSAGVGVWNVTAAIPLVGAANVAGFVNGSSVSLFVASAAQNTGTFVSVVDATGYGGDFSGSVVSTLSTSGTNYAYRGVSFVPRSGVATTTTITGITPATAEQADSVAFTATVAAGSGTARPTGTVQFRSGTVLLATATIADGSDATTGLATVTVPMTDIPLGSYTVTAQYIPDGNPSLNAFNPGTSAAFGTPLVIQAPGVVTTSTLASVTWAAQPAAAGYGDPITFAGRVQTADTSTPVGTVEIRNGGPAGTLLGSTSTFATDGSYTIVTSTPIPSGTYANLAAHFIGATGFKGSSSADSATTLEISSTVLTAGDIAFTGLKVEGTPEKISFVLLKDVLAGTTLVITDNAWNGSGLTTNEGSSTITFTQGFAAGTEFDYDSTRTAGSRWQAGGSGAGLADVTTAPPALGNGGDNLFAYQGAAPTTGSAAGWIAALSTQAFITTGTASTVTTYLPTALALGDTAFALGLTNASLSQDAWLNDLGTVTNTAAGIRATVYTLSNWSAGLDPTTSPPVVPSATIFVLGSPSVPTIGTTGTLSAVSTTYGTASKTTSITVTGSGLTGDVTATAPTGFEVSSDGTTFSATATFAQVGGSASGTLYVRLAATTAAGTYSGDVTLASTGATGVNAAIPSSTVEKKTLTVTAGDASRLLDEADPAFTAAITGFVNGETVSVVTGAAALSTAATGSSPAGTYAITAAIGTLAATNYDFTFVPGTLTVGDELVFDVAAAQTVTYSTARSAALKVIKRGAGTLVLDVASAHTGQTTVESGTLVVAHGDALAASPVRVVTGGTLKVNPSLTMQSPTVTVAGGTLDGTGATLLVNATTGIGTLAITSGSVTGSPRLTVSGNGVVTLPTDRRQVVALTALSIDQAGGGRLDIGKGRLDIAVGGTTEAELRADLIAGRNGNAFNGTSGIMTTGGKASTGSQYPVVGYRIITSGANSGAAIVAWAAYGDTNLDGQVTPTDTGLINQGAKFGKGSSTGATWAQGDFNYSGGVTSTDIGFLNSAALFGKGSYLPVAPAGAQAGSTSPTGTLSISQGAWIAFGINSQNQTTTTKKKM